MNQSELKRMLQEGKVRIAANQLRALSFEDLSAMNTEICGDEDESDLFMPYYTALVTAIADSPCDSASLHGAAMSLLLNELVWLPGAYSAALYHSRMAAEAEVGDVEWLEQLLFFDSVPDRPLPHDEACEIAKEVLTIKPDSTIAKKVLERPANY